MVCSILDGGRVRIDVTVRGLLLLLLVLWMRGRGDGVRCALARRLLLGGKRRGRERCRASDIGVARRARDRRVRDLERVHRRGRRSAQKTLLSLDSPKLLLT